MALAAPKFLEFLAAKQGQSNSCNLIGSVHKGKDFELEVEKKLSKCRVSKDAVAV